MTTEKGDNIMSNFTNTNSNIGSQGDGSVNNGILQSGSNAVANLQNNSNLDKQIDDLKQYILKEDKQLNKDLVHDLEESKETNNKEKFFKTLGYLKDSLGPIVQIASIYSSLGLGAA